MIPANHANFPPGWRVSIHMTLFEDVRFGLRTMAKNPGFTAVAVIALALGIGVNATVFTISNGVFKNMPFVGDRILFLSCRDTSRANSERGVSYPDFVDWGAQAKSFEGIALYDDSQANVSDKVGVPARYNTTRITTNTFALLGAAPVLGRDLRPEDGNKGAPLVALLSDKMWTDRYGRNLGVLGVEIRVNSVPATIVGVMPPDFQFPGETEIWTQYLPDVNSEKRDNRGLGAIGKLVPGATQASATAEMKTITHNLEAAYPATNKGITSRVRDFREFNLGPDTETLMFALMGAVSFVLLIACANVANMLLSRAISRSREISIRVALGAGRWRIIRQLLIESIMLSIAGGALSLLIVKWGLRVFEASVRSNIPAWIKFPIDYHSLIYLAAVSIGTGVLFGLAPALRLSKLNVNSSLKDGGRGASTSHGKFLSSVLVVTEMALAVVLLVGAGVMIRSFLSVYQTRTGVNEKNVLVMRIQTPETKYKTGESQIAFHDRLKARIDALPGVASSCISITMPTGGSMDFPYEIEGRPRVDQKEDAQAVMIVSPSYFRTMDVRLQRGREFADSDNATAPGVAIVNQKFAEATWPGEDPIGQRLRIFVNKDKKLTAWLNVIGIAPNILQNHLTQHEIDPLIYVPFRQMPRDDMSMMARTTVPPQTLATAFRQAVQALDEDMPVYNLRTLEQRLATNYWDQTIFGGLFGTFAIVALLLATVGLYAVIAHSVNQRTQEIGVRIALGASGSNILGLVLRQGMLQLSIGLAIGLAGALATTRMLVSELNGISPNDPVTFGSIALVLSAAAILGCLIPARRAMSVDPVIALRNE